MTDKLRHVTDEENGRYGTNNPITTTVTVSDSVGAILLGILAFILLLVLLRSQARNRELVAKLGLSEAAG
jgi:hypothetical protein